jgi:hypothetical protein
LTSGPRFRAYQKGDEESIVALLTEVFNGWPNFSIGCSSEEHWKWKYLENPFKKSYISLATLGDEIIGVNHSFPIKINIEEETIMGSFGSDLAVHQNHRGKGISRELQKVKRQLKDRTAMFSLYVSSNPIVVERRDETRIPSFPHLLLNLVRIKDINKHLKIAPENNEWLIKLGFKILNSLNIIKNKFIIQSRKGRTHTRLEKVKFLDERIDDFWEKVKEDYTFIIERNKTYLDWRYLDNRSGDFIINLARNPKGEIIGYIVTTINRKNRDYPIGYIMDVLGPPENGEVVDKLIANAIEDFDRKGINLVNALMFKNHPFTKIFLKNGFLDSRRRIHLFAGIKFEKEMDRKIESLNPEEIHFTYGDIDSLPSI